MAAKGAARLAASTDEEKAAMAAFLTPTGAAVGAFVGAILGPEECLRCAGEACSAACEAAAKNYGGGKRKKKTSLNHQVMLISVKDEELVNQVIQANQITITEEETLKDVVTLKIDQRLLKKSLLKKMLKNKYAKLLKNFKGKAIKAKELSIEEIKEINVESKPKSIKRLKLQKVKSLK